VALYFLDTSTVVKRYILEIGTAWVQALTAPTAAHSLFVARVTLAETVAAVARRERGGTLDPADAATALADFQFDFSRQYRVIEVSAGLVGRASSLALRHALRGYDAVQLSAAMEASRMCQAMGLGPITVISADLELNAAAAAEGLPVDDPNMHP
jgi:predicted nucleic acid-binding protein